MIIEAVEHGLDLAANLGPPRSPGLHMSDLYGAWYKELDPKRYNKPGQTDDPKQLWELGMCWEDMLEEGLKQRHTGIVRPGEFQTAEGIWYSPDLLLFTDRTTLGEMKLTFMSSKGAPWVKGAKYTSLDPKFNKYITQMKLYCYHLETPYARLYVFFIDEAAPWAKKPAHALRAWDFTFTARELREEWDDLMRFARKARLV